MTRVTVRIEGHYEAHEAPFGRSYEWHPASVTMMCDCGEELTLTGSSTAPTCRCGADHSALINDLQKRKDQAAQHLRDEAAYPEGSPRRYNDVTSGFVRDDEERWKKARGQ